MAGLVTTFGAGAMTNSIGEIRDADFLFVIGSNTSEAHPIIMVTSRVGDKHRARAIELGVNDYIGKPFEDVALLEAISRLLEEQGKSLT